MRHEGHTELLLARHPEVQANVNRVYIGRGDSPYTRTGEAQAESLASSIAVWEPDLVRTSPVARARYVGELLSKRGFEVVVDEDLTEIDFGAAEGLTYNEAKRHGIPMDFLGGPADERPFGGGETWGEFGERLERAAQRILDGPERVAVVTHGGVFRGMLVTLMELQPSRAWRFAIPPACLATVSVHDGAGVLHGFGLAPGMTPWETATRTTPEGESTA